MGHQFYSIRTGQNPNAPGLPLAEITDLFSRIYSRMKEEGFFHESFGFVCVDAGEILGKIADPPVDILFKIKKRNLWPIELCAPSYSEDDLFDVIEYLYQNVSKPIDGHHHDWMNCGMHWHTFNRKEGQVEFRNKMNELLGLYVSPFELSESGEILRKPERGFEAIFAADLPTDDHKVASRVEAAVLRFRRHGATLDDRRHAVNDLASVLEYLRGDLKGVITKQDESDLFNIANNFGIRHHNDKQKTGYDAAIWLSWMFYIYLATIHMALRRLSISCSS